MTLTYVSLFSGIEAFSVAASRIPGVDWQPVFFSEIDPFPCAVLAHRFPGVPNLGDICKIKIHEGTATNGTTTIPLPRNGIDILAGGSPCQDVSIAGRRAGMSEGSGTRSSLAFEYARLVEELRPRVILWENVPGVLSSNGGRDFLAFQRSLVERGYSLAFRVLDAQYTRVDSAPRAVPQRRKRVWLVGCLGDDGRIPAQILFERPSLLGDTAPRREAGQGFAAPALYGPARHDRGGGGALGTADGDAPCVDIATTLMARDCKGVGERNGEICGAVGVAPLAGDVSPTLDASYPGHLNLGKFPVVPTCLTPEQPISHRIYDARGAFPCVPANEGGGQNQQAELTSLNPLDPQSKRVFSGDMAAPTLNSGNGEGVNIQPSVLVSSAFFDGADCSPTLRASNGTPGQSNQEIFSQGGAYLARVATYENHAQDSRMKEIDVSDTRSQKDGTGGNNLPLVVGFNTCASTRFPDGGAKPETAGTLAVDHREGVAIGFKGEQSANGGLGIEVENAPTLSHSHNGLEPTVAIRTANTGANGHGVAEETTHTLDCANGQVVALRAIVRRLTPGECESLQFFPQGWTRIPYRGKPASECPDSPRYKALGNSWATNCAEWILRRIVAALRLDMIDRRTALTACAPRATIRT